jgi:uncharacterized protein YcnI
MRVRKAAGAVALAAASLGLPAAASAHVFTDPAEAPSGGFPLVDFVVPHGCDGSPTTEITVQIPKEVPSVTPQRSPFYELSTREGPKDETELFGEKITEGISEITWTATEPLPDAHLDKLGVEMALPELDPGETIYFPTIQKCEKGETRWIQIPAEGETEEDLESPAPAITLTEAEGGHGTDDAMSDAEDSEEEAARAEEASENEDDGDSNGLSIAALVVGGLGLVTGGIALGRARR